MTADKNQGPVTSRWWHILGKLTGSGSLHRPLGLWGRDRFGFTDTVTPFLILFIPHLIMALGMTIFALCLPVLWLLVWADFIADYNFPNVLLSLVLLPFGGLFTYLLSGVILTRRRVIIDSHAGTVTERVGLALPLVPLLFITLAWRRHRLDRFTKILIHTAQTGKTGQVAQLTVALSRQRIGNSSEPDADITIAVTKSIRYLTARRLAERLAGISGLPIDDRAYGDRAIRNAADRDRPLIDMLREQPPAAVAAQPPAGGLRVLSEAPLAIALPRPEFLTQRTRRQLGGLGIALAIAWVIFAHGPSEPIKPAHPVSPSESLVEGVDFPSLWPWRWAYAGWWVSRAIAQLAAVTAVILALVIMIRLWLQPRCWLVEVHSDALVVSRRGLLWWRRMRFPWPQLEELRLHEQADHAVLVALSDRRVATFPEPLPLTEARWLQSRLLAELAHSQVHP
ncbi:MAG: hypothetical protein AAB263_13155 [Planctomycetota bacterium]